MNKIKYYLDETDQIEVDGHTLSRLYLAEDNPEIGGKFAIYGADNTNRKMGGYVENVSSLATKLDNMVTLSLAQVFMWKIQPS